jgi:hypothetical protein
MCGDDRRKSGETVLVWSIKENKTAGLRAFIEQAHALSAPAEEIPMELIGFINDYALRSLRGNATAMISAKGIREGDETIPVFLASPGEPTPVMSAHVRELLKQARHHLSEHANEYNHPGQPGLIAEIDAELAAVRVDGTEKGNLPIGQLMYQYALDGFDFSDPERVKNAALRYVQTMPDSQVRTLLYALATA